MKKSLTALSLTALLCLTGCASTPQSDPAGGTTTEEAQPEIQEAPKPLDLTGTWKQTNSNSEESYHEAVIEEDAISVFWMSPDSKSLYWAGTYVAPTEAGDSHEWDSKNDVEQTATALMASGDPTKKFSYEGGVLSYETTMMGTTMTMKLERQ